MPRAIIYDGLRLFLGATVPAPRGVDRVDLQYAKYLFEHWRGDCFGMLPTPWGLRLFSRARGLRLLNALEARWRESADAHTDPVLKYLQDRLTGHDTVRPHQAPGRHRGPIHAVMQQISLLSKTGIVPGSSVVRTVRDGAVYMNIGQLGWAARMTTGWLRRRPDVRAVFMLHDIIPMAHPELVSRSGFSGHHRMLRSVRRHAVGLITTTQVAGNAVLNEIQYNHRIVLSHSSHLPVADVFLQREATDQNPIGREYFLMCGAIEPRKNHLLLLKVWQHLVRQRGARAPMLILAGTPAYRGQEIVREIARHHDLQPYVVVVSGLSSPGLRRIMINARALLAPSFAEGFGLPLAEALALGTPVLASDLPSHREVGGVHATYLDPTDMTGWGDWIARMLDDDLLMDALRRRAASFQPMTTDRYFAGVRGFLEAIA
jgi:glycosyltransferase involved in cell wall biosynthesis